MNLRTMRLYVVCAFLSSLYFLSGCCYPTLDPLPGKVAGSVRNAITDAPLSGVKVEAYQNGRFVKDTLTDNEGNYEMSLPSGDDYQFIFQREGFLDATYNNITINPNQTTFLEAVLQVDENFGGNGSISGAITNAITGQGVAGLNLSIRAGIGQQEGEVIASTTTEDFGAYRFDDIPAGNYTVEASGTGYITTYFSALSIGETNTPNQNATISPEEEDIAFRIVLSWGETPSDLDAHLTGPIENDTSRFHIYFFNKTDINTEANLDIDDVTSFGPETITIPQPIEGTYRYSVHNYSNKGARMSHYLAASRAKVKVFQGTELIAEFNVPNQEGTLWTVFEIQNSQLTPVNNMSYESEADRVKSRTDRSDADLIRKLPNK